MSQLKRPRSSPRHRPVLEPKFASTAALPPYAASSRLRNSRSFWSTSSSNRSTEYLSASLRWRTARALSRASPSSFLPVPEPARWRVDAPWWSCDRRPPCSSARALRVSMRRSCRAIWRSARSRSRATKGPISSRRDDSAAARVGCGMSS